MSHARRVIAVGVGVLSVAVAMIGVDAQTQTQPPAPAPNWSRPGHVFLSGENPWIFLSDTPGGAARTQVSFWRIHWSPVGPGHVCFVTVGDAKATDGIRIALTDNQKLLDYLTTQVLGTYNKAYLDRPFTPIGGATFTAGGDAITERRETCKSETYAIELAWRELREPALNDIRAGARTTNPFGIRCLFGLPLEQM